MIRLILWIRIRRSRPARSTPSENAARIVIRMPNSRKAMKIESSVKVVRTLRRHRLFQIERQVLHAGTPVFDAASPFSRCSVRLARSAARGSCVTMTMVLPCSRFSVCSRSRISSPDLRSRSPVGSSQSSRSGRSRWRGRCRRAAPGRRRAAAGSGWRDRPARRPSARSAARFRRSAFDSLVSSSGSSTLRSAFSTGSRL